MKSDIEKAVAHCGVSEHHQQSQHDGRYRLDKVDLTSLLPMDWITSDLLFFNGQFYIVVRNIVSTMTFFNRCAEDSDSIIQFFHSFQLWYGQASKIWLDGGHCYKSTALSKYCQDNQIKHEFSVPYHPAAIIESPVLRAKFCLRCGTNMKVDPQLILSSYQDFYLSDCHTSHKDSSSIDAWNQCPPSSPSAPTPLTGKLWYSLVKMFGANVRFEDNGSH